jgi:putative RecB family exonuclease
VSSVYSNSRIETFEQCPRKYKFRYIEKIKTEAEGIEAFLGKRVHESLEKLYRDLRLTKVDSLEEVLAFYENAWEKNWHGKVTVVREGFTPGHYFAKGQQCLKDYYQRYRPFNQGKTLGLEERIDLKLQNGNAGYSVQGYIDRLTWVPETETYEIHDYKTSDSLPTQEEADQDRQLALYQLGLLQRWPDVKTVKLVWHYLAADKEITSTRVPSDLKKLEAEVVAAIQQIEQEAALGRWEMRVSRLCEWCEYKPICPAWKHPVAMEALTPNAYLQDTGVQLVQKYAALAQRRADLQAQLKTVETEREKMDEAILAYADKEDLSTIDGPDWRLQIRTEDEFKVPRKTDDPLSWELLRNTLKNAGKLEDVSTVNSNMLKFAMRKEKWPVDLVKSIKGLVTQVVTRTVSLVKK